MTRDVPESIKTMTEDDVVRADALLNSYRAAYDLFQITCKTTAISVTFKHGGSYRTLVDYGYNLFEKERKIDLGGYVLAGYADRAAVEEVVHKIAVQTHNTTIRALAELIEHYIIELKKLNVTPNIEPTPVMLSYMRSKK